jgi:small-conductance mechanosensitive channel
MFDRIIDFLREPFAELSGTPISPLSILIALLIVVAARVISRVIANTLRRALSHHPDVGFTVAKMTRWLGMIVGLLIALTTVGLDMTAVFAAFAVLLVGIGFGLQKMAENFISGLILLIERPLKVGDYVQVDAFKGTVKDIGLRATKLLSESGQTYIIPNGELITKVVTNLTAPSPTLEITVPVGVAYGSDLAMVRRTLLEIAEASPSIIKEPKPEVRHEGFGDSTINLALEAWIAQAHEDDDVKSDLRFAIAARFAELGIELPFPQREVHILGGQGDSNAPRS